MKLMTKELEKRFEEIGCQEETKDPIVIAKFFNPSGEKRLSEFKIPSLK